MSFFSRLMFPPYAPDLSDQETQTSQNILNVLPQADGYGPFASWQAFSQGLPAGDNLIRGSFFARNSDGSITVLAATATNIYALNNTTLAWTNVSQGGGPYVALSAQAQWKFEQFGTTVIAVQANVNPQAITVPVSGVFADLGGSPPQAAFIAIVNRFVVLSGLSSNPYRIQWSDLDAPTTWTPGTGQADFQDLPDGGICLDVLGFDLYGVVFQSNQARLLTYTAGSPVVFTITKITGGDGNGLFAPYSAVIDQDNVFWLSQEGMKMMAPGGAPVPIGKEIVDRYIFKTIDDSNFQLCSTSTDPQASRLYLWYKSRSGQANQFDTVLAYDWELQRWSRIMITGLFIDVMQRPGATEENLDNMTPGAVSITGIAQGGTNGAGGNFIRLTVSATGGMSTALQQTGPWSNAVTTPPSGFNFPKWNVTQMVFVVAANGTDALSHIMYLPEISNPGASGGPYYEWGTWSINVIDGTHVDLNTNSSGSVSVWKASYATAYTSGGVIGGNEDLLVGSPDNISTSTTPKLCAYVGGQLGFFTGPNLQATLETAEQGTNEQRMYINGLRLITDAPGALGAISYRENPNASYSYTTPVGMNQLGVAPHRKETRYARAQMVIPSGQSWSYAQGVEPDGKLTGNR